MRTLLYNGNPLNVNDEHELKARDNTAGFNVTAIHTDGSVETFQNCTEVHYKLLSKFGEACAFESDIHSTGLTRDLHRLQVISVADAEEIHEDYTPQPSPPLGFRPPYIIWPLYRYVDRMLKDVTTENFYFTFVQKNATGNAPQIENDSQLHDSEKNQILFLGGKNLEKVF